MIEDIKELYKNEKYFNIYDNKIYIYQYKNIDIISENKIIISFSNKKVIFNGNNFILSKLEKHELLILGKVKNIDIRWKNG